ncbi:MAG: signal peptidase I [Marmoricola sp.]
MIAGNAAGTARWGRRALNALCIVVTLLALAFLAPSLMGLQRYAIAGGSMTGTYDLGSIVFDRVVPVSDLRVGDVITYLPPADSNVDNLVTHRIVSIHGDRYRTKGDANPDVDPWTFRLVASTQPRVVASVPYVGWALLALQRRDLRMLAIGVPAALVALLSLLQLLRALRERRPAAAPAAVMAPLLDASAATTVVLVGPGDHPITLPPRATRTRPVLPRQRPAHAARPVLPRQRLQPATPAVASIDTAGEAPRA